MPLREYECPAGHRFERIVKSDGSDEPDACPECGAAVRRRMSAPTHVHSSAAKWRTGNERQIPFKDRKRP